MLLLIELISDVKTGTHANKLDNRQSIGKTCDWKYFHMLSIDVGQNARSNDWTL